MDTSAKNIPAVLSWRTHALQSIALGLPLVGSQLGGMLMNTTDTVMLGWYGVEELAAGGIATQLLFTIMLFGAGLSFAVIPLAAEAVGKGDIVHARRSVRMGLWASFGFCVLAMVPLWFVEPIFLALGQRAEIADLARQYMRIAQWSVFPLLLWWTLRGFYTAVDRTRIVFWATLFGVVVNAFFNWVFIFGNLGAPELGIRGAAVATLGSQTSVFAILVYCAHRMDFARPYELFVRFWKPDPEMLRKLLHIGIPIGLTITAETGMFICASLLMGMLGVVALAAHGVVLQIASLSFMVPMGMAQAATARVGQFAGQRDNANIMRAASAMLAMCIAFASCAAVLFFLMPESLIQLFLDLDDPKALDVLKLGVPLLFVAACFQLVDTAQAIGAANLRGLQDTRVPMILAMISYWIVGIPLSYGLGIAGGFGGIGVWIGLAAGLGVAALLLNGRFYLKGPERLIRSEE